MSGVSSRALIGLPACRLVATLSVDFIDHPFHLGRIPEYRDLQADITMRIYVASNLINLFPKALHPYVHLPNLFRYLNGTRQIGWPIFLPCEAGHRNYGKVCWTLNGREAASRPYQPSRAYPANLSYYYGSDALLSRVTL